MKCFKISKNWDLWVLFAIVLCFVIFNGAWLWYFRHGQLLNIDEAGYIGIALADYQSLLRGGVLDFIKTVEAPSIQAPITTTLAALVFVITGPHVIAAFIVTVMSDAACVVAAFFGFVLDRQQGGWFHCASYSRSTGVGLSSLAGCWERLIFPQNIYYACRADRWVRCPVDVRVSGF